MNGYYIQVTNNLLDKKHIENMGSSVWLFMWLLDRMTSVNEDGVGKVLGGKPITYEIIEESLGISKRTYARWIETLRTTGYINTIRTPAGLSISVNKAKKNFGKRSAKNGTSEVPKMSSDVPNVAYRSAKNGTSNIRQYSDNTKTIDNKGEEKRSTGFAYAKQIADSIKQKRVLQ